MPKKSLQGWYNSDDINYNQKEIIKKFGVGDYYPEHELKDFRKIYYWNDILERKIFTFYGGNIGEPVYQINFFSTWWNNNLILFIDGEDNGREDYFWIKLIFYEMPHRQMKEILEMFPIEWNSNLSAAKREAKEIEQKLRSDNPILNGGITERLSIFYYDDYNHAGFPVVYGVLNKEIKRIEVDFNSARYNPDGYFKPLDIVMICREKMVHACIYLGNNKICHALSGNQVRIEDWNNFFILAGANKMLRYHPVIAFKKTDEIIKHIANCVEGQETYYSPEKQGRFSINGNNCENFTNRCVLGINFSHLAETKKEKEDGVPRKSELNIKEQLNNTKNDLEKVGSKLSWSQVNDTKNKIKEYRQGSGYENFNVMRDGVNMFDACIEVQPPKYIFREIYNRRNN